MSLLQKRPQPKKLSLDIIQRLPKAELHCHLDGSVRVSTIIELAREQGVTLPTMDPTELKNLVTVSENCTSLVEYLRGFDITLKVLQKYYALVRVVYEACEDAARDGVTYVELRFAPILHTREGMALSYVMKAVCEGRAMAECRLPITCRIIVCGMRQLDRRVTDQIAEIAWRYRDQGVVGFDLAGPEQGFSSKIHRAAFELVRSNCLNCTLHSGEAAGWESIQDSIRFCGAHRIGHGVRLTENPELMQFIVDRRIPLEMCPTSNIQTKACPDLDHHPIRFFFDKGVVVVPCTDNVTVSGITLSEEYLKLHNHFDFSVEEVLMLIDNSFSSSFLEQAMKQRFRAEAWHRCLRVLTEEGFDLSGIASTLEYMDNLPSGLMPDSNPAYWALHDNPMITTDIIRALPKADLHVRFNGSMSLEAVWMEIKRCPDAHQLVPECLSFQDLKTTLFSDNSAHSSMPFDDDTCLPLLGDMTEAQRLQRKVFLSVLQTQEQICRAMEDIYAKASDDGVVYLELTVRPREHTMRGLSEEQVVETILAAKHRIEEQLPIKSGIVLFVHNPEDDPCIYRRVAELVVRYRDRGVCAFGVFGDDIVPDHFRFYLSTFRYLKEHNVLVTMASGRSDPQAVLTSIHDGGATRISGAYKVHERPSIVRYLANHSHPVELSLTQQLKAHTVDVMSFAGNIVRLFLDNNIRVVICSFAKSFDRRNLSETLFSCVDACNLSIAELLTILSHGYRSSFQPHEFRERLFVGFWNKAKEILEQKGFRFFQKKVWIPTSGPRTLPPLPPPEILSSSSPSTPVPAVPIVQASIEAPSPSSSPLATASEPHPTEPGSN